MLCGGGMEAEVELVRQQGEGWLIIMQHTVLSRHATGPIQCFVFPPFSLIVSFSLWDTPLKAASSHSGGTWLSAYSSCLLN